MLKIIEKYKVLKAFCIYVISTPKSSHILDSFNENNHKSKYNLSISKDKNFNINVKIIKK